MVHTVQEMKQCVSSVVRRPGREANYLLPSVVPKVMKKNTPNALTGREINAPSWL
jgi:hypothetical protein